MNNNNDKTKAVEDALRALAREYDDKAAEQKQDSMRSMMYTSYAAGVRRALLIVRTAWTDTDDERDMIKEGKRA